MLLEPRILAQALNNTMCRSWILRIVHGDLGSAITQLDSLGHHIFEPEALNKDPESVKFVRQILEDIPNGRPWVRRLTSGQTIGPKGDVIDGMAYRWSFVGGG